MTRRRWLVTLAAALALLSAGCTQRLRSSTGEPIGFPIDINETDTVLSVAYLNGVPRALVLAGPGGGVSVVSGPDGAGFQPYAFNDAGVIVGAVITGSGRTQTYRAARWSAADGFTLIPRPAGTFQSWASDINNAGQIVLNAYSPSGSPADGAYLWTPGAAAPERLPDPPGPPNGRSTVAEAIN